MKILRFRLAACVALCATLLALGGCANLPANRPSALKTPHNGPVEAP